MPPQAATDDVRDTHTVAPLPAISETRRDVPVADPASTKPPHWWGLSFLHPSGQDSGVQHVEIYYGTMFGSAEQYARLLAHDIATQRRVRVVVHDLDTFDEHTFAARDRLTPSRVFVFIVSTHFAGAPSPSAERFRDWLVNVGASYAMARRHGRIPALAALPFRRHRKPLAGMQFAVFGIGDSTYRTFNLMGKFLDTKLRELGATRFHALGLGDCSKDLGAIYRAWEETLQLKLPPRPSTPPTGSETVSMLTFGRGVTRRLSLKSRLVAPVPVHRVNEQSVDENVRGSHDPVASGTVAAVQGVTSQTPTATSGLIVRDNFGRSVRLRFRCRTLPVEEAASCRLFSLDQVAHRASTPPRSASLLSAPRLSGPRTPRVALFDPVPFGELEPIECIGTSPSFKTASFARRNPHAASSASKRHTAVFRARLTDPETSYTAVSTLAIFPLNSPELVQEIAEAFGFDLDAVVELHGDETRHTLRTQLPFPTPCTVRTALTEFIELRTLTRELVRVAAGFVVTADEKEFLESLASSDGSSAFRAQIQDQHKGLLDLVAMTPTLQIPFEVFVNVTQPIRPRYFTIATSPRVAAGELTIAVSLGTRGDPQGLAVSYFERLLAAHADAPPAPFRGFISSSQFQFADDGVSPMVLIAMGVGIAPMRAILQERLLKWAARPSPVVVPTHLLFLGSANEDAVLFRDDLRRWEQQLVLKVHHAFSSDARHPRRYVHDVVTSRLDEIVQAVQASHASRVFVCGRSAMVRRIRELFDTDQVRRRSRWFDTVHASGRFIEEDYT